jgi:hypothetical protein
MARPLRAVPAMLSTSGASVEKRRVRRPAARSATRLGATITLESMDDAVMAGTKDASYSNRH